MTDWVGLGMELSVIGGEYQEECVMNYDGHIAEFHRVNDDDDDCGGDDGIMCE